MQLSIIRKIYRNMLILTEKKTRTDEGLMYEVRRQ